MALTRKFLSALGIESDKIDEIITAHTETVDALKHERDTYKADAEKLPGVQAELDGLKANAAKNDGKDPWKVKYDALKEDFDTFKKDQKKKETTAKKADAFRALLKECGVREKRIDAVLRVTDLDGIELDEDGKIKDAPKHKKDIETEWEDFIDTQAAKGVQTATPPSNKSSGTTMTRADVYKTDEHGRFVLDASQRQAALKQIIESEQKGV